MKSTMLRFFLFFFFSSFLFPFRLHSNFRIYYFFSLSLSLSLSLFSSTLSLYSLNPSLHFVPATARTRLRTLSQVLPLSPLSFSFLCACTLFLCSFFLPTYLSPRCVIPPLETIGGCCESRGSSRLSFSPPRLERGPLHSPPCDSNSPPLSFSSPPLEIITGTYRL